MHYCCAPVVPVPLALNQKDHENINITNITDSSIGGGCKCANPIQGKGH